MIQCIHGRHASAAYAMYYLAKSTSLTYPQIQTAFAKAGFKPTDTLRAQEFLAYAKVNLPEIIAEREMLARAKEKAIRRNLDKKKKRITRKQKNGGRHH